LFILGLAASVGCSPGTRQPPRLSTQFIGEPLAIAAPLGLPPLPATPRPPTQSAVALGKMLYFRTGLSADGSISCATCHDPAKGLADGRQVSLGVGGRTGRRNAPTVRNAVYGRLQFWDGRAASLEEQALGPLTNSLEMAHTPAEIVAHCDRDPGIRKAFAAAFGEAPDLSPVSIERVTAAIAAYERTLVRGNSAFDRFFYGGDSAALTAAARQGFEVFRDPRKGNCTGCHTVGPRWALFTDQQFHNLGAGMSPEGELRDLGRYEVSRTERDRGAFRTPSLRDVAETAPYMHDGSLRSLKEVVDFYVGGGNGNPHQDPLIRPLTHLTGNDRSSLIAFLESLTGKDP
jgi:cytochrome c peroxidase